MDTDFLSNLYKLIHEKEGEFGMKVEEELIWPKASSKAMVSEV